MAYVGAVYSIRPAGTHADDIDEVVAPEGQDRPKPRHKHVWAELTRRGRGETPVTAKEGLFCTSTTNWRCATSGATGPVVC